MKNIIKLVILGSFLLLGGGKAYAFERIDVEGYVRSGIGWGTSNPGQDQICLKAGEGRAAAAEAKYRMGNECDTYSEFIVAGTPWRESDAEDAPYFHFQSMLAYTSDQRADWEALDGENNQNIALRELNLQYRNSGFFGSTIWAGKKYYQRKDIHMNDFFYVMTAGPGFGVEYMDFGFTKMSFAVLRNESDYVLSDSYDVRFLSDVWSGGTLELIAIYGRGKLKTSNQVHYTPEQKAAAANTGFYTTIEYVQKYAKDGENKFVFQLGTDAMMSGSGIANPTSQFTALNNTVASQTGDIEPRAYGLENEDTSGSGLLLRFINHGSVTITDRVSLQYAAIYQIKNYDAESTLNIAGRDTDWLSFGLRPGFAWDARNTTVLELGFDAATSESLGVKDESNLFKATLAQQIQAGDALWGRPVIRAFVTQFAQTYKSGGVNQLTDKEKNPTSFGVQMEWWN